MKKKLSKKYAITIALSLIMLLSPVQGLFVCRIGGEEAQVHFSSALAYSEQGSVLAATVISPSELLILAEEEGSVLKPERIYLDTLSEWNLLYNAQIPHTVVNTAREGDTLTLSVSPYTYPAKNQTTVTFIPTVVVCGDMEAVLTPQKGIYTATLTVPADEYPSLTVTFEAEVTVPHEYITELTNKAYTDAVTANKQTAIYEAALEAYVEASDAYRIYLDDLYAYEIACIAYQNYLVALDKYEEAVEERREYEAEYAKYEEKLAIYNDYLAQVKAYEDAEKALQAEIESKKEEIALYEAYIEYLAATDKPREVLSIFETVYVKSSTGKRMYSTLMGSTVTTVIDHRTELVVLGGVSEEDIFNAGDCTDNLRALLTEYEEIEDEVEKYAWYTENYEKVRDNFTLLYTSLNSLFRSYSVKAVLRQAGKYGRYLEFLAHLYMISTGLDDSITPDPTWTIDAYTLYEILEKEYWIDDRNAADPRNTPWPTVVPKTEKPVITTELPPYPSVVIAKPLAPTPVPDPGDPPKRVDQPIKPTECPAPGEIPEPPYVPDELRDVIPLVLTGDLTERETSVERDVSVTLQASVTETLVPEGSTPILYFHDAFGGFLMQKTLSADVLDSLPTPSRPPSEQYCYSFIGWGDREGNPVDVTTVKENSDLYPLYEATDRLYSVTFSTYAGDFSYRLAYGDIPNFTGDCDKPDENGWSFVFVGWDKPIRPVRGDVVYAAHYISQSRSYTVKWQVGDTVLTERYYYGEMPEFPFSLELLTSQTDLTILKFEGWDQEIREVEQDIVYVAILREAPLLPSLNSSESGSPELGNEPSFWIPVTEKASTYAATIPSGIRKLSLATLLSRANALGKGIVLTYEEGYTIEFDVDTVEALHAAGADVLSVTLEESNCFAISFSLKNTEGEQTAANGMRISFKTPDIGDGELFVQASQDGETFVDEAYYTWEDNTVLVVENGYTSYRVSCFYTVIVSPSQNGNVTADRYKASPGEMITLYPIGEVGFVPSSVFIKTGSGTMELIVNENGVYEFQMPEGNVQVEVTFALQRFTVEFYVDGVLYSVGEYSFGDEIVLPENPTKKREKGIAYKFAGWSPYVSQTVTGDAVYEAVFMAVPHAQQLLVKVLAIILAVIVAGVIAWAILRKNDKLRNKILNVLKVVKSKVKRA